MYLSTDFQDFSCTPVVYCTQKSFLAVSSYLIWCCEAVSVIHYKQFEAGHFNTKSKRLFVNDTNGIKMVSEKILREP